MTVLIVVVEECSLLEVYTGINWVIFRHVQGWGRCLDSVDVPEVGAIEFFHEYHPVDILGNS